MRIVAVTTSWPQYPGDFAGRFVFDLHAALSNLGHEVLTVAPASPHSSKSEDTDAGRVVRLGSAKGCAFYGDGLEANLARKKLAFVEVLAFLRSARRLLRRKEYDVSLAHWVFPSAFALQVRAEAPTLGIVHGGDAYWLAHPWLGRWLRRATLRRCQGVAFTSEVARTRLEPHLGETKTGLVRMGVPPRLKRGKAPDLPLKFVLGVGRLVPVKGFEVLIEAMQGVPLPLVLIGEGPEGARLLELAQRRDVQLWSLGRLDVDDTRAVIARAAMLVVPSRKLWRGREEGSPLVVMEGMTEGIPVLGSRTGGIPELLSESYTFEDGDAMSLRARIHEVLAGRTLAASPSSAWTNADSARALLNLLSQVRGMRASEA